MPEGLVRLSMLRTLVTLSPVEIILYSFEMRFSLLDCCFSSSASLQRSCTVGGGGAGRLTVTDKVDTDTIVDVDDLPLLCDLGVAFAIFRFS